MDDDYKTKKNDFISRSFIDEFLYLSEDYWLSNEILMYFSVPIWSRNSSPDLDKWN